MAQIQIHVIEAKNLKKKDLFSENDAYVQVYLAESDFPKQKTTVKSNTKDPVWNQILILYEDYFFVVVRKSDLNLSFRNHLHGFNTLQVELFDKDRFHDDKIGSVTVDLTDLPQKRSFLFFCLCNCF